MGFFYNVLYSDYSKLNSLLKQNKLDYMYFIFSNFLLGLSPPLPYPTVDSSALDTKECLILIFKYFFAVFNTFSHCFSHLILVCLVALLCESKKPRDFTFLLHFLNKSIILVQILNCLHRLSIYPLARK